ncbi:MAG: MCP four helix bundle domain-containing protein [Holophagales bacterium]|jgi:hypothetical protein|nr:MCP four helix bundle domain-containing protein [Holophagales bacterium]
MDCYHNLKIKSKLMLGFAVTIVLTLVLGFECILDIRNLHGCTEKVHTKGVVALGCAADLGETLNAIRTTLRDSVVETDQSGIAQQLQRQVHIFKLA